MFNKEFCCASENIIKRFFLFSRLLAPHLSKLPMPEDYALMELKDLTRSYMLEVTQ